MARETGKRLDCLIKQAYEQRKDAQCLILDYQEIVTEDMQKNETFLKDMTIKETADYYGISYGQTALYLRYAGIKTKRTYIKHNGEPKKERKPKMTEEEHEVTLWASTFNKGRLRYVYYDMIKRCHKPEDRHYDRYGARGITVCDEWRKDCKIFYKWAKDSGYKAGLQLDRIDNNGNYEPNNCRWVSARENSLNKRNTLMITYKGKRKPLADWAVEKGLNYDTLKDRIYRYGWSIERALETKVSES